jgi:tetratricopeptide (TPR) repeat protein
VRIDSTPLPQLPIIPRPEFDQLRSLLLGGTTQLKIAIHGRPGIGKGELARQLAWDEAIRRAYPEGVLRVSLGQEPDLFSSLVGLTQQLGLELQAGTSINTLVQRLRAHLDGRHCLLFVVSAWDKDLARFFRDLPITSVVVTRFYDLAHDFAPEHVFTLDLLSLEQAVEFLKQLVPATSPEALHRLAVATGGLPLKLRLLEPLLAEEVRMQWSLEEFLTRVEQQDWSSAELDEVVRECLAGLHEEDRSAFAELGVFGARPADFDLPAAAAVWGVEHGLAKERLKRLVNANLVAPSPRLGRFLLHDDLAEVARKELPEGSLAPGRHITYYLDLTQREQENFDTIVTEFPQIRRAWSMIPGDSSQMMTLADAVYLFQERQGLWQEAIEWTHRALVTAQTLRESELEASLLIRMGALFGRLGETAEGQGYLDGALLLYEQLEHRSGVMESWRHKGELYTMAGDEQRARECYERALAASGWEGEHQQLLVQTHMAWDWIKADAIRSALRMLEAIRAQAAEQDDQGVLAEVWAATGQARRKLAQWRKAEVALERSFDLYKDIGHMPGQGLAQYLLGRVYLDRGDRIRARDAFQRALTIFQKVDPQHLRGPTLCATGIFDIVYGDEDRAKQYLNEALLLGRQWQLRRTQFFAQVGLLCLRLPWRSVRSLGIRVGLGLAPTRALVVGGWRRVAMAIWLRPG